VSDELRRRPPERTLRWAAEAIDAGSRIASVRRLTLGGWHANHALTVIDRRGLAHRVVLRRWARPEWAVEDPDFTAAREAAVLELLAVSSVPAPGLVAADTDAAVCDVPTLLINRLPGHPPRLAQDMGKFLAQLAAALPTIHAIDGRGLDSLAEYRTYSDLNALGPPAWSCRPELWLAALELARSGTPPGRRCFIHRDYHPENTLWARGRLTAIVDWTQACRYGPAAVDTGHMRWNLAIRYGLDAADEFLAIHRSFAGVLDDQPHWDLVTVLDVMAELDLSEWPRYELDRPEHYLDGVLAQAL